MLHWRRITDTVRPSLSAGKHLGLSLEGEIIGSLLPWTLWEQSQGWQMAIVLSSLTLHDTGPNTTIPPSLRAESHVPPLPATIRCS